jgi:hypothetical protein
MNTLTTRYNRERQQSHQHFSLPLNTHLHEVIPSPFIPPHTIVLAVHPLPPHDVHRGTVITARSDSYEVRFHDPTLGTHWVPDLAVMVFLSLSLSLSLCLSVSLSLCIITTSAITQFLCFFYSLLL